MSSNEDLIAEARGYEAGLGPARGALIPELADALEDADGTLAQVLRDARQDGREHFRLGQRIIRASRERDAALAKLAEVREWAVKTRGWYGDEVLAILFAPTENGENDG